MGVNVILSVISYISGSKPRLRGLPWCYVNAVGINFSPSM